jgi:hypothetical protein
MQVPKRIYAGAHYQNFNVSLLQRTDIQLGRISAWLDYLPNSSIQEHNKDVLNHGNFKSIDGSTAFSIGDKKIPSMELSILNWDFDTVTTSDAAGEFVIQDTTSGSADTIYGWVDNIIRREHEGKGEYFPTLSTTFLENEFLYAYKKQLPETSFNVNNIFIKGEQEINFGEDDDVSDNLFVLEKSPSSIVSEEMLKLFSTTQEFSNLFGRNIDKYRIEYKDLAKARELFYNKSIDGIDFDKFFEYFKWIDSSLSRMIEQIIPASVNYFGGIVDVIEPHILERDKYQRQVGLLQTVTSTEASIRGVQELNYNYRIGRAPLPLDNSTNSLWQKERRERDYGVADNELETIRQVLVRQNDQEFTNPVVLSGSTQLISGSYAARRFSRPYSLNVGFNNSIHSGINYTKGKNRDFLRSAIGLHSPIGASGAPKNVVTFGAGSGNDLNFEEIHKDIDTRGPNDLIKLDGFGLVGKYTDFIDSDHPPLDPENDYMSRLKTSDIFLGNIVSSSVTSGYNAIINKPLLSGGYREDVEVVNLHSDTTDITNEIPIQGPFTEAHIGGHQHRHVALNSVGKPERFSQPQFNGLDHNFSRPEGWRLLVGQNPLTVNLNLGNNTPSNDDGALGFTAPDYGISQYNTFPDTDRLYAIYYREERAKRPVNIKNIQTLTSSTTHGNYQHEYEVFSTVGDQGYFLKRAGNLLPDTIASELPETTNYQTLIAQSASVSGNYFGEGNNRQYEDTPTIPTQQALASFIFHDGNSGLNPDLVGTQDITIQRASGPAINFKILDNGGGTSGTTSGGYTIIDTFKTTWLDVGDQFGIAITDPTNGFGSDVTLVFSVDLAGTYGQQITIFLEEQTLNGASGNGGTLVETSSNLKLETTQFEGGADEVASIPGNIIETQDRSTGSAHVIRTRFSAPGGPEVNSSGYLDIATQQYSVHNSMNYRNLTVRASGSGEIGTMRVNSHSDHREGLRTLRTRHQGKFGIDSQWGAVSSTDYVAEASWHKQHRNAGKVAYNIEDEWGDTVVEVRNRYDNDHYHRPLPASDFQYSWINSAISGSNWENNQIILTYAPRNGLISSSVGITEAIIFPSASSFYGE